MFLVCISFSIFDDFVDFQQLELYLSSDQNHGWLGYIGDYTTQLYRDYNELF